MYSSPNVFRVIKSRRTKWAGHTACLGETKGLYRVLVGSQEGMRPLERPRHRLEGLAENQLASQEGFCSVEYSIVQ